MLTMHDSLTGNFEEKRGNFSVSLQTLNVSGFFERKRRTCDSNNMDISGEIGTSL